LQTAASEGQHRRSSVLVARRIAASVRMLTVARSHGAQCVFGRAGKRGPVELDGDVDLTPTLTQGNSP
jgi:hypothetical protein